jgi:hypothetical protein
MEELLIIEEAFRSRKFLKPAEFNYLYTKYIEMFPNRKLSNCQACINEAFKLLKTNNL